MKTIFKGTFTEEEKDKIRLTLLKEDLNLDEYTRNRDFYITKEEDIYVLRKKD